MRWLPLLAAASAAPASGENAFLLFEPPFDQRDWTLSGDARVHDNVLQLAHSPHQTGAAWFSPAVPYASWTLEAVLKPTSEFQHSAGEAGYALWFVNSIPSQLTPSSHPAHGGPDQFDGLAVMVDSLVGDGAGSVRGHLNDGTTMLSTLTDFAAESLSLCRIDYRQSAAPLSVRIGYSDAGFAVSVNHQKCFVSRDIQLFGGYFGITANTASTNDVLAVERLTIREGMIPELQQMLPGFETSPHGTSLGTAPTPDDSVRKIEALSARVQQIQSAIDQLSETVTLSLQTRAQPESKPKPVPNQPDLAALHADVASVRKLIAEYRAVPAKTPSLLALVCVLVPAQVVALAFYHHWLRRREQRGKLL